MRSTFIYFGFALCFPCLSAAQALKVDEHRLSVVVVDAHVEPSRPLKAVRVSLSFVDDAIRMMDARAVTNSQGEALLEVSRDAALRGDLRIEIAGAGDLVIYQPPEGQLSGIPTSVTVRLLPKGSPALLGPAEIEAMLRRLSLQSHRLQQEMRSLKGALIEAQVQKPDLTAAIAEWARRNGFDVEEVDKRIREWGEDIGRRKEQATTEQRALAELALKEFGAAAELFKKAADEQDMALDQDEKKYLEDRRNKLRLLIDDEIQSANAFQLHLQYHRATEVLITARNRAESEHRRFPDDAALREVWMDTWRESALMQKGEASHADPTTSLVLLQSSVDDLRMLAQEYKRSNDRKEEARTEGDLGNALEDMGIRVGEDKARSNLEQAVQAYQRALEILTKESDPKDWALLQVNLALALMAAAEREPGNNFNLLIGRAIKGYKDGLGVIDKAAFPVEWAAIQEGLGLALSDEADKVGGDKANALYEQSIEALRRSLEIRTKNALPEAFARTQLSLCTVLRSQGEQFVTEEADVLYGQALSACESALEVLNKRDLPQNWATAQDLLGAVLFEQAKRKSGDVADHLYTEAIQAFRDALKVYTKDNLPQNWAEAESNLGGALLYVSERLSGEKGAQLLNEAIQSLRLALQVRTRDDLPQQWASTQGSLGSALLVQAEKSPENQAALFDQAAQSYERALEIYTKETPQIWADLHVGLGSALESEAMHLADVQQALKLFAKAYEAFDQASQVYTETADPKRWADLKFNEGSTSFDEAMLINGDSEIAKTFRSSSLKDAAESYRTALKVLTKSGSPDFWARTELELAKTLKNYAESTDEANVIDLLRQSAEASRNALEVYGAAKFPNEFVQAQYYLGLALSGQAEKAEGVDRAKLYQEAEEAFEQSLQWSKDSPLSQDRAKVQANLGFALLGHADTTEGKAGTILLERAKTAFEETLRVYSRTDFPGAWAQMEASLGRATFREAEIAGTPDAVGLAKQTAGYFRSALEVYTPKDFPQQWTKTQIDLGRALAADANWTDGEKPAELLRQASVIFHEVLDTVTKETSPQEWVDAQTSLGAASFDAARLTTGSESKTLALESEKAYRETLQLFTKTDYPDNWAMAQTNVGEVCAFEGNYLAAAAAFESALDVNPSDEKLLAAAAALYHDRLFRFERAFELEQRELKIHSSSETRMEFIEASLTASKFPVCIQEATSITDPDATLLEMSQATGVLIRDTIKLGCQWGAGEIHDALLTLRGLSLKTSALQKSFWSFAGTLHFLSESPIFERARESWLQLFDSVQKGDSAGMTIALRRLEEVMQS